MVRVGVIGCGHWGPNHIRIFNQLPNSEAVMCADLDEDRLKSIRTFYPAVKTTSDYQDILNDSTIDAVCIASPTRTHYQLTKEALSAGKNVLCEKPLAMTPQECLDLRKCAQDQQKLLMVGHVFVFNRGIVRLKEYIENGELGRIQYAHSERTNLGPFRYDVNALWDLAPHDIAIFNYLFGNMPANVSARGQKILSQTLEDLAFASLEYPDKILVNVHVSWLDPKKVRQLTIVGDKKMLVWDDLDNLGPIRVYDKHVERTSRFYESYGDFQLMSREGSVTIPNIEFQEPLKEQAKYFLQHIENGTHPERADAEKAYAVVKTLSAIQHSMDQNGAPVNLESISYEP